MQQPKIYTVLEPIKFEKGGSLSAFYEYGLYLYSFESVEKFKAFVRINKWWYEHMRPEWKQRFLELAKKGGNEK